MEDASFLCLYCFCLLAQGWRGYNLCTSDAFIRLLLTSSGMLLLFPPCSTNAPCYLMHFINYDPPFSPANKERNTINVPWNAMQIPSSTNHPLLIPQFQTTFGYSVLNNECHPLPQRPAVPSTDEEKSASISPQDSY